MTHFKSNLDILDRYHTKDVWEHEGVVYSGNTGIINDQINSEKEYVSPLLAAAVLGLHNTATPTHSTSKHDNLWTDIDSQEMYLNEKPTCYLILGKPGLGAYSLGEALSKKYLCVHLCPRNILADEIAQGSLTGKCLDFNMKHNNVCTYQTILKMLKQKLESPAVKHRGYVISGIPLVTGTKAPFCLMKSKHSEEAWLIVDELLFDIIYNLKRKKPKPPATESSRSSGSTRNMGEEGEVEEEEKEEELPEEAGEEQEVVAELPKFLFNTCSDVIFNVKSFYETKQAIMLHQLQELFNLSYEPDVIIYITCPDADVITKKHHKYISYKNGQSSVEPFLTKPAFDLRWPSHYTLTDYENPHDIHVFNPKYNCRPPINFNKKSMEQICNYRHYVNSYIEKKIMDYNPKQVIKLDGRTSIYQMMHQISERLLLMHINPVIIPEPLYMEEPPEDYEEFWKMVEELNVIQSGVLNFKRCASHWFNRCPVELKKRQSVIGKAKFAVMFFKHVYLLSSLNNFISFCRNPRPYLKLKYLEPTCRIIVIGTKSSGKTMTAECLSWLFDTPIISFQTFLEAEKQKKYDMFAKSILSEIIATIEDARLMEWQRKELDRLAKLKEWSNSILKLVKEYIPLLIQSIKYAQKDTPPELVDEDFLEEEIPDPAFLYKFNYLREQLSFLPILDSVEECQAVLTNQMILLYASPDLRTMIEKPLLPILGDDDVMKAVADYIVANDLQNDIEPTTEELMNEMIKIMHSIDDKHQQETNSKELFGKYIIDGFPSDPEYWGILSDHKLIPDYTVAIMENRELEPELLLHYLNVEKCAKNYHEVLTSVKDPLILSKLQTKQFVDTKAVNVKIIIDSLVNNSLTHLDVEKVDPGHTDYQEPSAEFIASFTVAIEKFREDWDSIKIKLEEQSKCYIEIELENKTDVQVLQQVLLKLRQSYYLKSEPNEEGELEADEEDDTPKDLVTYNNPQKLCETYIYCPVTFYNDGVLWEGKQEHSLKYDGKVHYFAKEEFLELFQKDITKYQAYNKPFKKLPKMRICITGCLGSGATLLSKRIATELGLIHIDLKDVINYYYMPRHYKKVGRKYENPFTDISMEEEAVVEFQMDEENPNLLADILSNEVELRRMVHNYYERGQPIMPLIMHKIIKRLWGEYPYVHTGFVLDGYPRLTQDIEGLVQCNCIPDLVLVLDSSVETTVERLGPLMFKTWKSQLKDAKEAHKITIEKEKNEWMRDIAKKVTVKLIIEEMIENSTVEEPKPGEDRGSIESFIFDANPLGPSQVDPKLFSIYNEMIEEFPEPKDTREWAKAEDEREKINSRLESIYEADFENIEAVKEAVLDNKIKLISIDGAKPFHKVIRVALSKLTNLRNRTQSFFEQTFITTADIAEVLLSQGFCFLSKFGRICPVYIYKNPKTIFNSYKISRRKGKLFPIIHRSYVYFISSETNVNKFRTNPLKYISSDAIKKFYPYPLRIGIIGAPKSGKSSLAAKLAKRSNLICISRGMALHNILENMHWTELGSRIMKNLNNGETVHSDCIVNAVQTVAIDHRTVTYGFVLDGFPASPYEAKALDKCGLYPNIIFDLSSSKEVILESSQNEIYFDIMKHKPPYSYSFIENRFSKWSEGRNTLRSWISNDYQNICVLNGNESKWQCLESANNTVKEFISKIHHYLANVEMNIVPAHAMTISNEVFERNMSHFTNMCPVCLWKNVLRHSGFPVDKRGVVQFRNTFYWICEDHLNLVLTHPDFYLTKEIKIPEIPAVVKVINIDSVYENGICIVTYAENLPKQILERGTNKFAAAYKLKTYLFCSEPCLRKFLDKPHLYSDVTVFKGANWFPRLSLKKLPDLGYLEQTLANILTEACCSVNAVRPKYPGLTFQLSALIYIALYLKTHNPRLPKNKYLFYKKALKMFEVRSKLILDIGLRMRSMENPFLAYPPCHNREHKNYSPIGSVKDEISSVGFRPSSIISSPRRVPVPDERYDYLCEYHKPASKVPAFLNVVDIAGLVRGAAEGQGLGNAFLSHIKACDAIFNLCRAFDDEDVIHVDGDVNPVRDLETIGEELRLKDEEQLMQNFEKLDRVVNRGGDKKLKPEYDSLLKIKTVLVDEKKHIRFGDWSAADIEVLNKYLFLTSKPALYLVNLSEKDYIRKKNKWLPKLKEWIDKNDPGAPLIPFSGAFETKLVEMDPVERQAYLKENNLASALDKIIVQGYKALQLEYFFTAGPDEVKAWTIQKGTKAPQAAGRIHTDFEKGFIMAEVMHFKDFKEEGTEAACKAAGKYRQQGRNYVVEDGDIIFFKFNAGAGLKDAKKK